jgi:hypothetical protein
MTSTKRSRNKYLCLPAVVDNKPILSVFQVMLLEHIVMCRLVMGNKSLALQEIAQACALCQAQPRLLHAHRPQIHTMLGLYAMSMNCMEAAEAQFTAALRVRFQAKEHLQILVKSLPFDEEV